MTGEERGILEECAAAAHILTKVSDDLVRLHVACAGEESETPSPVAVGALLESVRCRLQRAPDAQGATLVISTAEELHGCACTLQAEAVTDAVFRIALNAVCYSSRGDTVRIDATVVPSPVKDWEVTSVSPPHAVAALEGGGVPRLNPPPSGPGRRLRVPPGGLDTRIDAALGYVRPGTIATPAGGGVEGGPHLQITVADGGVGLDATDLGVVFTPFAHIKAGLVTGHKARNSTGLGLAIVQRTLAGMGGGVTVVSPNDRGGCTFTVRLPLILGPALPAPSPPPPVRSRFVRVAVVVDDVAGIRATHARHLTRRGVSVTTLDDGDVAVAYGHHLAGVGQLGQVDVWLIDEEMPRLNGSLDIAQLRALGVVAPILSVTGNVLPADHAALLRSGADAVIVKPATTQMLEAALATHGLAFGVAQGGGTGQGLWVAWSPDGGTSRR